MGVPTYMYRKDGDEIEARVFDSDEIPEGWHDSPQAAEQGKRKPGKPRKAVSNDDGE